MKYSISCACRVMHERGVGPRSGNSRLMRVEYGNETQLTDNVSLATRDATVTEAATEQAMKEHNEA